MPKKKKVSNLARLFQLLRMGSTAQPHRNKKKYRRKVKHKKRDQDG